MLMMLISAPSSKRSLYGLSLMNTVVYLRCDVLCFCFVVVSCMSDCEAPRYDGGRWMGGAVCASTG